MADTYTVKKGDTLWSLAKEWGTTYQEWARINNIPDPNKIVVGQVLKKSGSADPVATNNTSMVKITVFGLQSNTDRTLYATWTWSKSNTENYQIKWYYDTGDNVWFLGTDTTVDVKQCTYNAPANAERAYLIVKPLSKKYKVEGKDGAETKEYSYWTANWSTKKTYSFSDNPPTTPGVPKVEIKDYTLTAELENLNVNGTEIQFQVVRDDKSVYKTEKVKISTTSAKFSCKVAAGSSYKVRCRAVRSSLYSAWTEYSENLSTIPSAPSGIKTLRASSETSVYIEWAAVANAETYDIEYTTEKKYFDGSDQTQTASGIEYTHYEKTGLESGKEYFFRIRAVNENGESAWSSIKSVIIGKKPAAPTTWSATSSVTVGDNITLYWVHNSEDNSSETFAQIEFRNVNTNDTWTVEVRNNATEEDKDKTKYYILPTTSYREGTQLEWRVRTAGITNTLGDWSDTRAVDIYAPPTLELTVLAGGVDLETFVQYPMHIRAMAGPTTQHPVGYHLKITANDSYETIDHIGNPVTISKGTDIYSQHFDPMPTGLFTFSRSLYANDVDLANNMSYTITVLVTMDSGLTAEASIEFDVAMSDELDYEPNAEIALNKDNWSIQMRPYCETADGELVPSVTLSVYRREFDGSFTEIARDLPNESNTYVVDPHPSLDFARYRIIAISTTNGSMSHCDLAAFPVNCKSVILQWDERWTTFDVREESEFEQPPWTGSLLELPYNIDVSNNNKLDVELIEYIGREHPVSYYGTQVGETASWSMSVPKIDKETLYTLRRLSKWMGDVYVREPSGSGYWASIAVSFSQKHKDLTIPVSLDITRVEGGM